MIALKKSRMPRFLGVAAISLATTLALIGVTIAGQAPGGVPLATAAHAAPLRSATCATTQGRQQTRCEHQDPIVQGCVTDAETLELHTVFQDRQQTKPLGVVELRYSPTCKAYWVRSIAFATTGGVFKAIHARLTFHDGQKEDIVATPIVPSTITPSVAWTDMTVAPLPPHAGSGRFDLLTQPQPITVTL